MEAVTGWEWKRQAQKPWPSERGTQLRWHLERQEEEGPGPAEAPWWGQRALPAICVARAAAQMGSGAAQAGQGRDLISEDELGNKG